MNTEEIRARLTGIGWQLKEIPIRSKDKTTGVPFIGRWRVIALRNERSFETTGTTLDEAIKVLGETLGVVPRERA